LSCKRVDRATRSQQFQTQLLKLYFLTTLYVDVKEPAPNFFGVNFAHISGTKKLNFVSDSNSFLPRRSYSEGGSVYLAGTKLSSNLKSQNVREQTPLHHLTSGVPPSGGIKK